MVTTHLYVRMCHLLTHQHWRHIRRCSRKENLALRPKLGAWDPLGSSPSASKACKDQFSNCKLLTLDRRGIHECLLIRLSNYFQAGFSNSICACRGNWMKGNWPDELESCGKVNVRSFRRLRENETAVDGVCFSQPAQACANHESLYTYLLYACLIFLHASSSFPLLLYRLAA